MRETTPPFLLPSLFLLLLGFSTLYVDNKGNYGAARAMYHELAARGVAITEAAFDGGGELGGGPCLSMYADLGIAYRPRVSEELGM